MNVAAYISVRFLNVPMLESYCVCYSEYSLISFRRYSVNINSTLFSLQKKN